MPHSVKDFRALPYERTKRLIIGIFETSFTTISTKTADKQDKFLAYF